MKSVVYHADSHFAWGGSVGSLYKGLAEKFKQTCERNGMEFIHLTLEGLPGWGHRTQFFQGLDAKNVVANREECFTGFLESVTDDEIYWFAELDYVIYKMWPALKEDCDLAMLYRVDSVPMTPAWRMGTRKALPFFLKCREEMRKDPRKDWHGDSAAFTSVWNDMGKPTGGVVEYLGVKIEFRDYRDYVKNRNTYSKNFIGPKKLHGIG